MDIDSASPGIGALAGRKIGVFGKGGAGKSTVTVFLARVLRARGLDVVVVDADPTNVGLAAALGFDTAPRSLIDFFGGAVFTGGSVTCPVDDPTPLPGAAIDLRALDTAYVARAPGLCLLELGKMGGLGAGAGCDGPITKIARDLRVRDEAHEVVTLIDFKAGFEDSSRGVLLGIDFSVAVIDPTPASIRMALDLDRAVAKLRHGTVPATAHIEDPLRVQFAQEMYRHARSCAVVPVLNRVLPGEMESILRRRLEDMEEDVAHVIHDDPEIGRAWMDGRVLPARPESALDGLVDRLADCAARRVLHGDA